MLSIEKLFEKILQSPDESIKADIEKYISIIFSSSKNDKKLLAIIKIIDWKILINKFDENYEYLYSSFNLSKVQSGIYRNKDLFKRRLLEEFRNKILLEILITGKTFNSKNINHTVNYFFAQYKAQHFIESMKLEESIKLLKVKEKIANKFLGKKYNAENLKIYGLIFQKNDEYMSRDNEPNYHRAAKNVIKYGNFESKYKSFNKFKNIKKIHTYKEFEKYLSTIRE